MHLPIRLSRRWIGRIIVGIWAPLAFVAMGTLAVGHWWTLPKPDTQNEALRSAIQMRWQRGPVAQWLGVHVLYSQCKCSERILRHLAERGPMSGISEAVVLVGEDDSYAKLIRGAGYALEVVTPTQLAATYHVEAAPMFAVMDPTGALRYLGGYTDRQQGYEIHDVSIVARLREHERVVELPLFGCAVSRSLQAILDPLGIKYRDEPRAVNTN